MRGPDGFGLSLNTEEPPLPTHSSAIANQTTEEFSPASRMGLGGSHRGLSPCLVIEAWGRWRLPLVRRIVFEAVHRRKICECGPKSLAYHLSCGRSLVRIQPSAFMADVAQWVEHLARASLVCIPDSIPHNDTIQDLTSGPEGLGYPIHPVAVFGSLRRKGRPALTG